MRITNKMMMQSVSVNLQRQTQKLVGLNENIATGKKILKPSDDPVGMSRIMEFKKTISQVDQYMQNITTGKTKLEVMENILAEVENQINAVKKIAIDQSMGVLETRGTAAEQVKNSFEQIMDLANSKLGSNYLFGGHQPQTRPFTGNADGIADTADDYTVTYNGDTGVQKIMIGAGSQAKVNADGSEIFTGGSLEDGVDVFSIMGDLIAGLENADTAAGTDQITAQIALLEKAQEQVNSVRTRNAGTYERLETTESYWENFKINIEQQLSNIEDVDITQAVVDLKNQELVYETTVSLAGEILKNSLLSFLN